MEPVGHRAARLGGGHGDSVGGGPGGRFAGGLDGNEGPVFQPPERSAPALGSGAGPGSAHGGGPGGGPARGLAVAEPEQPGLYGTRRSMVPPPPEPPLMQGAPGHGAQGQAAVQGHAAVPSHGVLGHREPQAPPPDLADDEDPPDEPAAQFVEPADAALVARMTADVLVIDGRPRYHLTGCVHLLGRESEPLPVGEAVELGFTPCGRCEPDSALLHRTSP
ncbi:hypothetical protein WEI85_31095 [Actinomycetes bacterium KLBMP 9797]